MLPVVSFLLASMAAPAEGVYHSGDVEMFKRVCLQGAGKFQRGEIAEIDFSSLPRAMRVELEFPRRTDQPALPTSMVKPNRKPNLHTSGQYFKIREGKSKAFLAIEDRGVKGQPSHGRYCSLATKAVNLRTAVLALEKNETIDPRTRGWTNFSQGYRLRVDKLDGGYLLLQSVVTGRDEAREVLERLKPIVDEASKAKIDEVRKKKEPE